MRQGVKVKADGPRLEKPKMWYKMGSLENAKHLLILSISSWMSFSVFFFSFWLMRTAFAAAVSASLASLC
jgi:hypothetical protein